MPEMKQVPAESPLMKAWVAYQETDDFKNSLMWATITRYTDAGNNRLDVDEPANQITNLQREQHAKGSLWAAFVRGFQMGPLALGNPWAHVPKHYAGRWNYDYDEKNSTFFVHCGGHRICDAEDSEVCDAICRAHDLLDVGLCV